MKYDVPPGKNFNAIDTHAHLSNVAFGGGLPERSAAGLVGKALIGLFGRMRYKYFIRKHSPLIGPLEDMIARSLEISMARSTPADLAASMAAAGVRLSVVLPVDPYVSTEEIIGRCDFKTFFPFSSPPVGSKDFAETAGRDIDAGCLGVKIHPLIQKLPLASKSYFELAEVCAAKGVPLITHFGGSSRMFAIADGIGHMDARDIKLVAKNKKCVIIIAHCGLWQNEEVLGAIGPLDNVFADTSFQEPGFIAEMVRKMGGERVMLGSDFPIGDQARCVENVMRSAIGDECREKILNKNALSLFKFGEARARRERYLKAPGHKLFQGEFDGQK